MAKQQLLDALDHLKRWELNGCQIRDVITMAQSWTLMEKRMTEALGLQHIELVAGQTPRVQYFFDEDYRESRFKLGGIKGRAFVEKRLAWRIASGTRGSIVGSVSVARSALRSCRLTKFARHHHFWNETIPVHEAPFYEMSLTVTQPWVNDQCENVV